MQNNALPAAQTKIVLAAHLLSDKFGAQADTARILAVMAAAVPNRPEIIAAQARNLLIARQYPEARDLLTEAEGKHPGNAVIKALLAMCMFVQKDSLWEAYAEEALALPRDAMALGIVEMLSKTSGRALRGLEPRAEPSTTHHYAFVGLAC